MVFNRPDGDIKPDRDLLLRQALHLAKYENLGALRRQSRNRAHQQPNTCATIDNVVSRSLAAIFYNFLAVEIP